MDMLSHVLAVIQLTVLSEEAHSGMTTTFASVQLLSKVMELLMNGRTRTGLLCAVAFWCRHWGYRTISVLLVA